MSSSKHDTLYGFQRQKRMRGDKEISSNTSQTFTSQLSSLISNTASAPKTSRGSKARKEDIFTTHNRNTAKRAKRDQEDSPAFATQKHTTNGETLDNAIWQRSKRKMEEKARLYAAIKRGDVEDTDEKYAVDFDRKWSEKYGEDDEEVEDDDDDDDDREAGLEMVEYTDEFGRTRQGTRAQAALAARIQRGQEDLTSDRFTARPLPPSSVIYGDTIQHQAFNPDEPISIQMANLAKKRDRSLTPPPDMHFDANAEVRTKGTGFFQFSEDTKEREQQMESLKRAREETERMRREGHKRKADEFLEELALKMEGDEVARPEIGTKLASEEVGGGGGVDTMDAMQRIEAALARERDD